MKVYLLFDVTYDYHRFEELNGVFLTKELAISKAQELIEELQKRYKAPINIFDYAIGSEEYKKVEKESAGRHYWILEQEVVGSEASPLTDEFFKDLANKSDKEAFSPSGSMYYLDLSEEGYWLIRGTRGERYSAGKDKNKVQNLIHRLNRSHRVNIEQPNLNEIYVCWNNHEKGEKCEFEREI